MPNLARQRIEMIFLNQKVKKNSFKGSIEIQSQKKMPKFGSLIGSSA